MSKRSLELQHIYLEQNKMKEADKKNVYNGKKEPLYWYVRSYAFIRNLYQTPEAYKIDYSFIKPYIDYETLQKIQSDIHRYLLLGAKIMDEKRTS